jgi:ParB/RepB/Spo0J family partition protein
MKALAMCAWCAECTAPRRAQQGQTQPYLPAAAAAKAKELIMSAESSHVLPPFQAPPIGVPVSSVFPSPTNPRKHFDKASLEELTASVRKVGIVQPVLVRPWPASRKPPKGWAPKHPTDDAFELVVGERRLRAAQAAGLENIPALSRELNDDEVLEIQLIENLHRSDMHPLDEADAFHRLIAAGRDLNYVADRIGKTVKYIYDREKLLALTKDAQKLFREGSIILGHAIILARLQPADQVRAIGNDKNSPLFHQAMGDLWGPDEGGTDGAQKPISVRELQEWVDDNVRFDKEVVEPLLFPETAEVLKATQEEAEKVVSITRDYHVQPAAKDDKERTIGPMSWKRADGKAKSKACPFAVTGVVVVGDGRGEAFKVCTAKKSCEVHWGTELRAAKKRAKAVAAGGTDGESRQAIEDRKRKEQQAKEQLLRKRLTKAAPAITQALADAVKKAPANATSVLAQVVVDYYRASRSKLITRGKTAEDLVRYLAFGILESTVDQYWMIDDTTKRFKQLLGIDVTKILDEAAPIEKAPAAAPKAKATTKKKPAKGKKH